IDVAGTALIVIGVIALAIVEHRLERPEPVQGEKPDKYRFSALALLFPIAYCLFDTIGTAADGIILNEETGPGLGEIDVLVLYGLTFFLAGIVAWFFMLIRTKKAYNPFRGSERDKGIAALCEEGGQIFYVYAMASRPVLAAPMIASYCIVSVILSRIFIREKLKASQYACVVTVIAGIVLLGISEGLSE
ncbi:MAG: EamA family transporter, partial [Lachnospiraceae bacterium]|nr:EamA family transporter [Lachnospiraceae bacterium]